MEKIKAFIEKVKAPFAKAMEYREAAAAIVVAHPKATVDALAIATVSAIVGKIVSFIF